MTYAKTREIKLWLKMQSQKLGGMKYLAKAIGMPYTTFSHRLKDAGKFNADELRAIVKALKLTDEERQGLYKLLFQ